jgi:hypothetical protein
MSNKEVPLDVKAVSIIRDHYAAIAQELTELLKQQVPQEVKDTPETPQKAPTDVQQLFPKELSELLTFEDQGKWTKISPKQFLGSDNFARVLAIVKELNGEYISAGKGSHFRIPKVDG